jgi:hypothetical protein
LLLQPPLWTLSTGFTGNRRGCSWRIDTGGKHIQNDFQRRRFSFHLGYLSRIATYLRGIHVLSLADTTQEKRLTALFQRPIVNAKQPKPKMPNLNTA